MKEDVYHRRYDRLRQLVDRRLEKLLVERQPRDLMDGCRFVLEGGGKRVRSTLVLLACEAVGGRTSEAINAATAVELLHNFTLVHDDIMDNASTRRGRPTVHTKWNLSNAILVGDVLLGLGYRLLLQSVKGDTRLIARLFTDGLLEVCIGQAFDIELEKKNPVTVPDYFRMIEKKTGRLISASTELGGLIGGGDVHEIQALKKFGHHLGRAFQLQDDLLDVIGDERDFGKKIGGDIIEGKRTFLLLTALERAKGKDKTQLRRVLNRQIGGKALDAKNEIAEVKRVFEQYGVIHETQAQIQKNTRIAMKSLQVLPNTRASEMLSWFSEQLVKRTS